MKATALGVAIAIFIFLLLIVLLQSQIAPPPPPLRATFAAVSAEAARAAEQATHEAAERNVTVTTEAIQTATGRIQTRSAGEASSATTLPT